MIDPKTTSNIVYFSILQSLLLRLNILGVDMAHHVYMTDKEHDQAALDRAARIVFDRASEILSSGNPVSDSVTALSVISNSAVFAGYSNTSINVFYTILADESSQNDDMEGWRK